MIQIYLCDDEETVLHQIKTALEWKIFVEDYDMEVSCAARCARDLLEAAREGSRSVYFLDVDLRDGEWDGFTLGRELRRRDPHGTLIYITSYGDLAWKTFQYHLEAFDYIVKEGDQMGAAAARCLGKSNQFVRVGLQRGLLPFGNAVPGTRERFNYYISPIRFRDYVGAERFNEFFGITQ